MKWPQKAWAGKELNPGKILVKYSLQVKLQTLLRLKVHHRQRGRAPTLLTRSRMRPKPQKGPKVDLLVRTGQVRTLRMCPPSLMASQSGTTAGSPTISCTRARKQPGIPLFTAPAINQRPGQAYVFFPEFSTQTLEPPKDREAGDRGAAQGGAAAKRGYPGWAHQGETMPVSEFPFRGGTSSRSTPPKSGEGFTGMVSAWTGNLQTGTPTSSGCGFQLRIFKPASQAHFVVQNVTRRRFCGDINLPQKFIKAESLL
ncbi:hypothetical protein GWK47_003130 [Chionoecetes opilio]|uniref:Uncharacterized protein n=1 Tax=Chionoecetes opilio TaxID=41210 RepID=A0A8J8WMR4_CHIOP|nr:hypothetical protein GWK47_003130 [Chionoecetes opilio]